MTNSSIELTPMMKQWSECKKQAGSALLLFRLGDFYEAFYEDASLLSETLMIAYTKRGNTPMAGIPAQSLENSIEKCIESGICVAIAEQMDVEEGYKGIVSRKVTRVETLATFTSRRDQNSGSNNFLLSISVLNQSYSIAYTDTSTAEFFFSSFSESGKMTEEILRIAPKEILINSKLSESAPYFLKRIQEQIGAKYITIDPLYFDHQMCVEKLHKHLKVASLDGFGLKGETSSINACGSLLTYLENNIFFDTSVIVQIKKQDTSTSLLLDHNTLSHLEIFNSPSGTSLFKTINFTVTAMGERLLKTSLLYPLTNKEGILIRQNYLKELLENEIDLSEPLQHIKDIERLMGKIARKKASPIDLILLANSLERLSKIILALKGSLSSLTHSYKELEITEQILHTIRLDDTEYFIAKGINEKLDQLKEIENDSVSLLKNYEAQCRETLGIKTLKVGQNRSFGYYIEVSSKASHLVPDSYHRKQTLVNGERFVTKELAKLEHDIQTAKSQALSIEQEELERLTAMIISYRPEILHAASLIAQIDFIHCLKTLALSRGYICPTITTQYGIDILEGAHPILKRAMRREQFIPNDIHFNQERALLLLTGPNMAGKSTYIKSVALLVILAQIGSFIPAKSATIGIVDKIFTRIGAFDDLQRGQSTFMVEMTETANILRNATSKSLIILDEIGRGTSTFDGVALAKSIATYIVKEIRAKTLFATHYLELTDLAKEFDLVKNIRSAVSESGEKVTFLHKIEEGKADQSYGIFVGELAGLPRRVILDAKEHLSSLIGNVDTPKKKKPAAKQYTLFNEEPKDPIISELETTDVDHLTPFEALQKLIQWKKTLL